MDTLTAFQRRYGHHFGRPEARRHAEIYLRGLLDGASGRRSAAALAGDGQEPRALQRFLSGSRWPVEPLIAALQRELAPFLSAHDGTFVIGEVGFPKQGPKSAGVALQPSGWRAKVVNCQVGVFLAYASSRGFALIDARLYLPSDWIEDLPRRRAAGIPDTTVYRSREELALEMLHLARRRRALSADWVASGGPYAQSPGLRQGLDAEGLHYLLEAGGSTPVSSNTAIAGDGGPSVGSPQLPPGIREPPDLGRQIASAPGTQPAASHRFTVRRAHERHDGTPGTDHCLVVRRDADGSDPRYYLSNFSGAPLEVTARVSERLDAVERYLREAGATALGGYEVRSWLGWHHHVTLALVAGALRIISDGISAPVISTTSTRNEREVS